MAHLVYGGCEVIGYLHHLIVNLAVAGHALVDAVAHLVHGVLPFVKVKHHQPVNDRLMIRICDSTARLESEGRLVQRAKTDQDQPAKV